MNVIKQYGLERSGTNYIKALLEINGHDTFVCASMFGPKHNKYIAPEPSYDPRHDKKIITEGLDAQTVLELKRAFNSRQVKYVVSIKNPYSWVVSFRRFVKRHELHVNIDIYFLIKKWNEFNRNWIENLGKDSSRFYMVEYESLIENPEQKTKAILNRFNIPMKGSGFIDIENNMKEGYDVHGSKNITDKKFDRMSQYVNKEYMSDLSDYEIGMIQEKADFSLLGI